MATLPDDMLAMHRPEVVESSQDDDLREDLPGDDNERSSESYFPKIYEGKFLEKYKEIDHAIHKNDLTYLQKLISEKVKLRSTKNEEEKLISQKVMNLSDAVNFSDDPLLSVVIAYEKSDLALRLVEVMSEENLKAKNIYGDTALHVAAAKGEVSVVEALVKKCNQLKDTKNSKQETPLHKAALYGQREAFWKLVKLGSDINQRRNDGSNMLHYAVTGNALDLAMKIASEYADLITIRNTFAATPMHLMLTINTEAFRSKQQLGFLDSIIYNCIPLEKEKLVHITKSGEKKSEIPMDEEKQSLMTLDRKYSEHYSTLFYLLELIYRFPVTWIRQFVFNVLKQLFPSIQELKEQKQMQKQAMDLILLMASYRDTWDYYNKGGDPFKATRKLVHPEEEQGSSSAKNTTENSVRWTDSPLLIGAKMGLDEFVKQILRKFPQSAHNLNTEGMNVLQVAIKYGHEKIVNDILLMIRESNSILPSGLLSSVHEATGNTILHFAAEKNMKDEDVIVQMKYEFQWFEKVRNIVPKELLYCRNKSELTAEELFTKEHDDMTKLGKKQLTGLGKTCSGLVAAVVFASSFSIPGDKDANQNPVFLHRTAFKVFSHAYVIGLSSAATSLVLFLSFLISSYREQDFRRSLRIKYLCAIMSFLIALVALLVAFSCNIYLQIYGGTRAETKDIIPLVFELTFFPTVCLLAVLINRSSLTNIRSFL